MTLCDHYLSLHGPIHVTDRKENPSSCIDAHDNKASRNATAGERAASIPPAKDGPA